MISALDQFYHPNLILFLFVQDLKSELDIRSAQCTKQTDLIAQLEDHVEQLQTISTPYRYSVHTISIPYRQCTNNQYTVQVVYRQSVHSTGSLQTISSQYRYSVHAIRIPYRYCTDNQYTVQVVYIQLVHLTGSVQTINIP